MKHLFLFTFFITPALIFGQTLDWIQTVESSQMTSSGYEQYDISVNEFGEALLMGPYENIEHYNHPFGTLRAQVYTESGDISFTETYGGRGRIIDMVSNGDYFYIAGEFLDTIQFPGFPALTMEEPNRVGNFLLKLHREGEVMWVQETMSILPDMSIYAIDIHSSGTLYIGAGDFAQNSRILQMNEAGEVTEMWTQTNIGLISSISVNEAGSVSIAGSCAHVDIDFNGTNIQNPIDDYNIYAAHYNADGEYQWSRFMLDVTCPLPKVLLKDDGATYFAGDLPTEATLGDFDLEPSGWVYSFFYSKISETGEVLWVYQTQQPEDGIGDAALASGQAMIHWGDDVMLSGFTRGQLVWDEDLLTDSEIPGQSLFMTHFNPDGQIENLIYGDESDFSQTTISMSAGPNGSLYMIGMVYDTLNIQGQSFPGEGFQLFISRWGNGIIQSTGDEIAQYNLRHYPDPAHDSFTVEGASDGDQVLIYDILGRPVYSSTINGTKRFNVSQFPAGTYVLQVVRESVPVYRSSIRVVH